MGRLGRVPKDTDMKKTHTKKNNVYINNSNFELAFSVILPPLWRILVTLQTFLENYWDILKSIGKIVRNFNETSAKLQVFLKELCKHQGVTS